MLPKTEKTIKELRGFNKSLLYFFPNELNKTYQSNHVTRLDFPTGLLDLSTFNLFFDVQTEDVEVRNNSLNPPEYYILKRFSPRHSSSYIDRLRILINDNEISNLEDYNLLFNMVSDVKENQPTRDWLQNKIADFTWYDADGHNLVTGFNKAITKFYGSNQQDQNNGYIKTDKPSYTYIDKLAITDWLYFFNQIKYINTYKCKLSIEIRWADPHILYASTAAFSTVVPPATTQLKKNNPDFFINNVRGTVHSIDFEGVREYETTDLTFSDWFSRRGLPCQTDKTQSTFINNLKSQSVNKVLGTFVYNKQKSAESQFMTQNPTVNSIVNYTNVQSVTPSTEYSALNNSSYFRRIGHGCSTSQFYINEIPVNKSPMNIQEMYAEILHMFNVKTTMASFLKEYVQDFFVTGVSLEDSLPMDKDDEEIRVSGYDTKGNNVNIRWETQGTMPSVTIFSRENFLGQPVLYVEFTKRVKIDGKSILVE